MNDTTLKTRVLLGSFFLFVMLLSSGFASAGNIIVRTVPESYWTPNHTYRVDVFADNTGLYGQSTAGANWQLVAPSQLAQYMTITQAQWPSSNDFFQGSHVAWSVIASNWNKHGKIVDSNLPSDRSGILATYYVTLASGANPGTYSFSLNPGNTKFINGDSQTQSYVVQNVPFHIPISTSASSVTRIGLAGGSTASAGTCSPLNNC